MSAPPTPGTPVRDTDADEPDTYLLVTRVMDETAAEHVVDYTWKQEPITLHEYDETNAQYPEDSPVVKAVYIEKIEASETYSLEDDVEEIREGPFTAFAFPAPRLEPL